MDRERFNISMRTAAAVVISVAAVEVLGVNRMVRGIVQVGFLGLEIVVTIVLCLFLMVYSLRYGAKTRWGFWGFAGMGLFAGVVSGAVGIVVLSIVNYPRRGIFNSGLSFASLVSLVGISILASCSWLVGILSGIFLSLTYRFRPLRREGGSGSE